jgi:hypothetical protein
MHVCNRYCLAYLFYLNLYTFHKFIKVINALCPTIHQRYNLFRLDVVTLSGIYSVLRIKETSRNSHYFYNLNSKELH